MNKVRWGVLSTAKIGREKVIPAMQAGEACDIVAIASENRERVMAESIRLNIPTIYNSYEELLNDPEIDAVYIPPQPPSCTMGNKNTGSKQACIV